MDVRCEKCLTLYDFDDAKVTDAGVTVKCTQCGNLFRVARRGSAAVQQEATAGASGPVLAPAMTRAADRATTLPPPSGPPAPPASPTVEPAGERLWMVRSARTGEVRKFRDLTTLQQWIVERKIVRDDEISRSGESWKPLGGIVELSSFFHIVEQAETRAPTVTPAGPATAVTHDAAAEARSPTMPYARRTGRIGSPADAANEPTLSADAAVPGPAARPASLPPPGFTAPPPEARRPVTRTPPPLGPTATRGGDGPPSESRPRPLSAPSVETVAAAPSPGVFAFPSLPEDAVRRSDDDDLDELPHRGGRARLVAAIASVVLAGAAGFLLGSYRAAMVGGAADATARGAEALRKGREHLALDADDDLRIAEQQLSRARGAEPASPAAAATLVELEALWSTYLADDARLAADPARAAELRHLAQLHLDDARREGGEAMSLAPDDADVNRAMATVLLASAAPTTQVEESLKRVAAGHGDDAALAWVRGALQRRDGHLEEARGLLEQANRLSQIASRHDLLRADYLLAQIALASGKRGEARAAAQRILDVNPHHERATRLMQQIDAGGPALAATGSPAAPGSVTAPGAPSGGEAGEAPRPATAPSPTGPAGTAAPGAPAAAGAPTPGAAVASPTPAAAAATSGSPGATPLATTPTVPVPAAARPPEPGAPTAAGARPTSPTAPAGASPTAGRADPQGYDALITRGTYLAEHGHGRDAQRLFEKALAERPGGVEALTGLGFCYLDTEHFSAAIDRFKEALRVSPSDGEAIIGLAEAYKMRGDRSRALEYYRKYLSDAPHGSKLGMAQTNVRELESQLSSTSATPRASEPGQIAPTPPN